jgi:predicted acetyltransferase
VQLLDARTTPQLRSWLRSTYDAYLAELVSFGADFEYGDSGWEPDYLPYWLREPGCYPYVAEVDGALVGFAFVGDREFPYRDFDSDFKIAEFCVVPEARRVGIGKALAKAVFETHPGRWELNVLEKNELALRFWRGLTPQRAEHAGDGMITLVFVQA